MSPLPPNPINPQKVGVLRASRLLAFVSRAFLVCYKLLQAVTSYYEPLQAVTIHYELLRASKPQASELRSSLLGST